MTTKVDLMPGFEKSESRVTTVKSPVNRQMVQVAHYYSKCRGMSNELNDLIHIRIIKNGKPFRCIFRCDPLDWALGIQRQGLKYVSETEYVVYDRNQLAEEPSSSVSEVEKRVGAFEYCLLKDGNWCIRTIPSQNETRLAVFGKNLDAAAKRLLVVLRLQAI